MRNLNAKGQALQTKYRIKAMASMFTLQRSTDSEGTLIMSNVKNAQDCMSARKPVIGGNRFKFDLTSINVAVFENLIINLN